MGILVRMALPALPEVVTLTHALAPMDGWVKTVIRDRSNWTCPTLPIGGPLARLSIVLLGHTLRQHESESKRRKVLEMILVSMRWSWSVSVRDRIRLSGR